MDLAPEELQFLSIPDILRESTSIPKLSPKTFYLITLTLIFPLSFAILAHSLFTHPLIAQLQLQTIDPAQARHDWTLLLVFQFCYLIFLFAFSLLSTAAVVFTVASLYTSKPVSFSSTISAIPKVFKRLFITYLCVALLMFLYHFVFVASVVLLLYAVETHNAMLVLFAFVGFLALEMEPVDPTVGFVTLPFNLSHYHIQKPYDAHEDQRYSFNYGVHRCWVLSTDKPHTTTSKTLPRTEIAIQGYGYSSGIWQFEGYAYVPLGTSGVCIMQVFGATPPHATTFMLRVYNGSLYYYRQQVLVENIYDRWFKLNVVHDVDAAKVWIYINGYLKLKAIGRGGTSHAFKCGVYAQVYDSLYMESRWKDIRILKSYNPGVCA